MALWRDPLDGLIDDLEPALPPNARGTLQIPRIEDVQAFTCAFAFGTEEDRARAYKDRTQRCSGSCGTTRSSPNCEAPTRSLADNRPLETAHRTSEPISHSVQSAMYWYVRYIRQVPQVFDLGCVDNAKYDDCSAARPKD